MGVYAISFALKHDETWNKRYESFMEAVKKCKKIWTETTSFCLVETDESLEALERRLFLTDFASSKDIILVIDVSFDAARARGAIKDKDTLEKLLPGITIS